METYSDQTRFILNANYHNKLIDPIQSRCSLLPFRRLDDDEISFILNRIIQEEDIEANEEAVDEIIDYVQGDARRAVQTLQMSISDGTLSSDTLEFINLQASKENIQEMIELAVNGQMEEAMNMNIQDIQPKVTDHSRFCKDVLSVLKQTDEFSTDTRFYAMSKVADMERNILEGASPSVQTNSFLAMLPVIDNSSISNYE
jgi:DNA polymerase III delta prime subunit